MSGSRVRIAVVDDDGSVCKALARLLRVSGFDVDTYQSAKDFLESLQRAVPECLVVDMKMPDMTGLELYHQLRSASLRIPTILITAHGDPETFKQARRAGIAACLAKPLQEASLLEAIEANTRQPD